MALILPPLCFLLSHVHEMTVSPVDYDSPLLPGAKASAEETETFY